MFPSGLFPAALFPPALFPRGSIMPPALALAPPSQTAVDGAAAPLTATLTGTTGALAATTTAGTLSTATPAGGVPFSLVVPASGTGTAIVTVTGPSSTVAVAVVGYAPASPEAGLIPAAQLLAALALTDPDVDPTLAPTLVAAASGLIRKHCRRYFNRRPSADGTLPWYDGIYATPWPQRSLLLREFPVNRIRRVRTNPTQALVIVNTARTTVQAATSNLAVAGVNALPDVPVTVTGLELWSVTAGVATDVVLPFGAGSGQYATLGALAAAVNALGGGWQATVPAPFADWGTAELCAGQGPRPALGPGSGGSNGWRVYADDIPARFEGRTGELILERDGGDPFSSLRWGVVLDTDVDDLTLRGAPGGLRVVYDAGFDTIPPAVAQACVATGVDLYNLMSLDQRLGSESDGARGYVLNTAFANFAFSKSALGMLAPWINHRA